MRSRHLPIPSSVLRASESCSSHTKSHLGEFLWFREREREKKTHLSQENIHTNNNVSFPTIPKGGSAYHPSDQVFKN